MADPVPAAGPPELAALWLATQHGVAAGAAHEIKNALNGVAVNLAVVQSRLRRDGAPETVTRFADAATSQLERLTDQLEALLALVRAPAGALDVGLVVQQLGALAAPGGVEGPRLALTLPDPGVARTGVDPAAGRLVLAAALWPALAVGAAECVVEGGAELGARVAVRAEGPVALDASVAALAAAAGVRVDRPEPGELVLAFPPAPAPAKL